MLRCLVLLSIGVVAWAADAGYGEESTYHVKEKTVFTYPSGYRGGRYYYGGHFNGKCGLDGLYWRDDRSFIICSNGNSYVQPCAPGTKNSGQNNYNSGYYYGYSDFCDINLVDHGYNTYGYAHGGYYYPKEQPVYEAPKKVAPHYAPKDDYGSDSYAPAKTGYVSEEKTYGQVHRPHYQ